MRANEKYRQTYTIIITPLSSRSEVHFIERREVNGEVIYKRINWALGYGLNRNSNQRTF